VRGTGVAVGVESGSGAGGVASRIGAGVGTAVGVGGVRAGVACGVGSGSDTGRAAPEMLAGVAGGGEDAGPKIITVAINVKMERKLNKVYPDILSRNQRIDLLLLPHDSYLSADTWATSN
jgi:hypothetical protein